MNSLWDIRIFLGLVPKESPCIRLHLAKFSRTFDVVSGLARHWNMRRRNVGKPSCVIDTNCGNLRENIFGVTWKFVCPAKEWRGCLPAVGMCEVKVWRLHIAVMFSLEVGSVPCSTCNFLHVSSQYLLLYCFAIMSSSNNNGMNMRPTSPFPTLQGRDAVFSAWHIQWLDTNTTGQKCKAIPLQALRVPGGWGSQISRQSAHEGGKFVSLTHRSPLHPRKYLWYSFLLEAESTPGS
jgi:hypothetical protein